MGSVWVSTTPCLIEKSWSICMQMGSGRMPGHPKNRAVSRHFQYDHPQWFKTHPGSIRAPIGVWQGQTEPVLASFSQIPLKNVILANGRFYRSTLLRFPAMLSKKHTAGHVKKGCCQNAFVRLLRALYGAHFKPCLTNRRKISSKIIHDI